MSGVPARNVKDTMASEFMRLVLLHLLLLVLPGCPLTFIREEQARLYCDTMPGHNELICHDPGQICPVVNGTPQLLCATECYDPERFTCYDTILCPIRDGQPTLRCGQQCYSPAEERCDDGYITVIPSVGDPSSITGGPPECSVSFFNLHLASPPYDNYFFSDCHSAGQVVVTSPIPGVDLAFVGPRVIVAWPAGNSGAALFFSPANGVNGTLGIRLVNSPSGAPLGSIYEPSRTQGLNDTVGVTTQIEFNSSAVLDLSILGSVRTIRDFVEGPSLLRPEIQDALRWSSTPQNGFQISRLWLDNITTTTVGFAPASNGAVQVEDGRAYFEPGTYFLNATFDFPQLIPLNTTMVLRPEAAPLAHKDLAKTRSLAFLAYNSKLLAGAWRFLTYFGRDSMISAFLLQPALGRGPGSSMEAVLSAVLERVNSTDGSVCHEETIGDYATWQNLQEGIISTAPRCDYKMMDTEYFLPILAERYFVQDSVGAGRTDAFFNQRVSFFPQDRARGLTYRDMLERNAQATMTLTAPFAAPVGQNKGNLLHLKPNMPVGQWRDSNNGLGGGRIPFDVNAALAPAALRSIAALTRAGILTQHPEWADLADRNAFVWENATLPFFDVTIPKATAQGRLEEYVESANFSGPSQAILVDEDVEFSALALDGADTAGVVPQIEVMHSDTAFRLLFVNDTNDAQLSRFLNNTAKTVMRRFPAGLMTDVSMLIANPAYGKGAGYVANFTTSAYHGTVVWSFQLALMARGLEVQLSRCSTAQAPAFCFDKAVRCNVQTAYSTLWDSIDANLQHLTTEVWSWTNSDDKFEFVDLGALPPPPGQSPTESDIIQLWSLTFLAVSRNPDLETGC